MKLRETVWPCTASYPTHCKEVGRVVGLPDMETALLTSDLYATGSNKLLASQVHPVYTQLFKPKVCLAHFKITVGQRILSKVRHSRDDTIARHLVTLVQLVSVYEIMRPGFKQ